MAIDFPSNPTTGQTYTFNSIVYTFTSQGVWQPGTVSPSQIGPTGATGTAGSATNTGATGPTAAGFFTPGGRLTLTTGVPVLVSTVSGATTVYYTPYVHRFVPIYNGSSFVETDTGGELSQTTADTTKSPAAVTTNSNYDVFVWSDSGTIRATRGPAWSTDTTRGTGAGTTELQQLQGIQTNKNAITNGPGANLGTYVGTVRSNGSSTIDWIYGAITSGATAGVFNVWNMYNRVNVATLVGDTVSSWSYTIATWRAANANNAMRVSMVRGLDEDTVVVRYHIAGTPGGGVMAQGIGVDSTTAYSGDNAHNEAGFVSDMHSGYDSTLGLGFHYVQAVEYQNTGTATWYGSEGTSYLQNNGLHVHFRA